MGAVVGGTFARNGLRGLFKILVAGYLGRRGLGIVQPIYSMFRITTRFVDLGLDYALVTFMSVALKRADEEERERILSVVLSIKVVTAVTVAVVGTLLAPMAAVSILGDAGLTLYVRLIFFAVGGQLLWGYVSSYLAAHQRFTRLAWFLVTMPVLMLTCCLVLIAMDRLSLTATIAIYLFAPATSALLWWLSLDRRLPASLVGSREVLGRILRFGGWVYLGGVASTGRNHLNPILLHNPALSGSVEAGQIQAGLYSFGNDLANEVTILSRSLVTVMLPKASRKTDRGKLRGFVGRSYRHLLLLLIPAMLLPLAAKPMLLMLGSFKASYLEYLPSLPIFAILYFGALFTIASIPFQTALYAMKLPQVESYLGVAMLGVAVGGGLLLIPRYGGVGAAVVVLIQRVISFVVLAGYGWWQLRRSTGEPACRSKE